MNYPYTCEVMLMEWGDCEINYDIIDGDASVGLPVSYEFEVLYGGDDIEYLAKGTDLVDMLTEQELQEVEEAIEKDIEAQNGMV